jgi:hypothetical protein
MSFALRALVVLICFELGVLLILAPWSAFWERNYFLDRYPELIPIFLNPFLRGAITGLGLLDVWIAFSFIGRVRGSSGGKRR